MQEVVITCVADDDADRKTQAEVLLNAYSRELERRRLAAGAQGLLIDVGREIGDKHVRCLEADKVQELNIIWK